MSKKTNKSRNVELRDSKLVLRKATDIPRINKKSVCDPPTSAFGLDGKGKLRVRPCIRPRDAVGGDGEKLSLRKKSTSLRQKHSASTQLLAKLDSDITLVKSSAAIESSSFGSIISDEDLIALVEKDKTRRRLRQSNIQGSCDSIASNVPKQTVLPGHLNSLNSFQLLHRHMPNDKSQEGFSNIPENGMHSFASKENVGLSHESMVKARIKNHPSKTPYEHHKSRVDGSKSKIIPETVSRRKDSTKFGIFEAESTFTNGIGETSVFMHRSDKYLPPLQTRKKCKVNERRIRSAAAIKPTTTQEIPTTRLPRDISPVTSHKNSEVKLRTDASTHKHFVTDQSSAIVDFQSELDVGGVGAFFITQLDGY